MAERYYNISADEMSTFLKGRGFQPMKLPNTVELVFGKIVKFGKYTLSLRVYTGINPSGESRAKGTDAIRVDLYCKYQPPNGKEYPRSCGIPQKCLRVKTWEKNLGAAIDRAEDVENFRFCSECGNPMIQRQRNSDGHKFWGCIGWKDTGCKGRPYKVLPPRENAPKDDPPPTKKPKRGVISASKPKKQATGNARFRIPDDMISPHQKKVEEVYLSTPVHIMMRALAGSGKTTMLKHLASFREASQRIVYMAFNKKNAVEGAKKLPREVASMTTHRFCGMWLRDNMKLPQRQDSGKNYRIMEEVYPLIDRRNKARKRVRSASFRLLNLSKHYACRPDDGDAIKAVMDKYTFDLESDGEAMTVVENVMEALSMSLPGKLDGMIYNYDDMLWWPIVLGLDPPKYDVLLADEVQDFNRCQIEIVQRMMDQGCRVVAVGDPFQAVYRFRGADNKAFGLLAETLASGDAGCQELVLPTNYRCGKAHIKYVQEHTIVKEIEAAPTALEGRIEHCTYDGLLDLLAEELLPA